MSKQSFSDFRALVNSSTELQQGVAKVFVNEGEGIVEFAKRHGYDFSTEEALGIFAEKDELSDFELELVAGGSPANCNKPELNV